MRTVDKCSKRIVCGLALLLLAGWGQLAGAANPDKPECGGSQLNDLTVVGPPPQTAETQSKNDDAATGTVTPALLKASIEELKSIGSATQKSHEELLGKYQSICLYNRRPQDLQLNHDEFAKVLPSLSEACYADIKRLKAIWDQLEQFAAASDGKSAEESFDLERRALEAVADTLEESILANFDILIMLKELKVVVPNFKPTDSGWALKEKQFGCYRKVLDADQQMLETLAANLKELPTAIEFEAIEQALTELQKQEWKLLEPKMAELDKTLERDDQDSEVFKTIAKIFKKVRGVKMGGGMVDLREKKKVYGIAFASISDRRRKLILAELEKVNLKAVPGSAKILAPGSYVIELELIP